MAVYENTGQFDLELVSSGSGWCGTFAKLLRTAVIDILYDGPYGPVEVTLDDGRTIAGVLDYWPRDDEPAFLVTADGELPYVVEVEQVLRFRA